MSLCIYRYDDASRLIAIESPGVSKTEFVYDGMGRLRISRTWTNLYGFVANDPLNRIDLYGLYVRVDIDIEDSNKITLTIPVTYKGDAATQELQDKWNKSIEGIWSGNFGKYHVTTRVIIQKNALNEVTVIGGVGRSRVISGWQGRWYADGFGGGEKYCEQNLRIPAHETGHLMGLEDKYDEETQLPFPTWEGNIMAQGTTGVVEEKNITDILKSHPRR